MSQRKVLRQFEVYSKAGPLEKGSYFYTDDTAMARQLADSLAEHNALNETDLARRFTEEFYSEPNRGYGGGVIAVFRKLRKQDGFSEPLQPAREQFNGTGSYGNGAAMRVHPVALGCISNNTSHLVNYSFYLKSGTTIIFLFLPRKMRSIVIDNCTSVLSRSGREVGRDGCERLFAGDTCTQGSTDQLSLPCSPYVCLIGCVSFLLHIVRAA